MIFTRFFCRVVAGFFTACVHASSKFFSRSPGACGLGRRPPGPPPACPRRARSRGSRRCAPSASGSRFHPLSLPLAENPSALPTLDAAKQAIHRVLAEDPSRRVLCRFRGARESAVDAELANGTARFDRAANLAAGRCDGIRFAEGEAWTSVAFNTAPAAAGRQHSTWVAAVAFDA